MSRSYGDRGTYGAHPLTGRLPMTFVAFMPTDEPACARINPMSNDPFNIPLDELRKRRSAKWTLAPEGALPLWVAEMDVRLAEPITARLREAIDLSDTGYSPGDAGLAREFAGFAQRNWDWEVDPELCTGYPDLGASGVATLQHFAGSDGRVVITPPVYNSFYVWLRDAGLVPEEVTLAPDGTPDLDGIDRALASGIRVVLISNPHNPFGRLWRREELTELAEIADRNNATVISDEIHAPLTHPGNTFVPFLTVSETARRRGIALHSASKAWNLAGLKSSLVVRAPESPTFPVAEEAPWSMGLLGVLAAEVAFSPAGEPWLYDVRSRLQERSRHVLDRLASELPKVRVAIPEAGYLMWLDLREAMPADNDPSATLVAKEKLFLSPGHWYGEAGRGFARLNIATSETILDDALDRLVRAAS